MGRNRPWKITQLYSDNIHNTQKWKLVTIGKMSLIFPFDSNNKKTTLVRLMEFGTETDRRHSYTMHVYYCS